MHIAIDMGGTITKVGLSKDLKKFFVTEKFPTPTSQKDAHAQIKKIISTKVDKLENILLGVAGFVDYQNGMVMNAPHINWINNMTAQEITGIDDPNIHLFNDAELAGLAESYEPYATDFENVAYITLSTGVGGTIIRSKKPATYSYNYEPGHIIIDKSSDNTDPVDKIRGSFESLCSGTAFYKKNKVQPKDSKDMKIWQEYGKDLANGLYTLTLLWQPDVIVLGGSMTNQWDLFYKTMIDTYTSYPSYYAHPPIIKSKLEDMNVLLGGLQILAYVRT